MKDLNNLIEMKIIGLVPCGPSGRYYEQREKEPKEYCKIPETDFEEGRQYYVLEATGDSMKDADICNEDLVLVEITTSAKPGDIIVALDENSNVTLKRLARGSDGVLYLHPENSETDENGNPLFCNLHPNVIMVQGIVRSVIKRNFAKRYTK